ncbi:DUF3008 family protein [Altererythrobacter sp.]|nr:DUF3008 family protein [Altererythrobacter sp.]
MTANAKSKVQYKAAGAVPAAKRGDRDASDLTRGSKQMYESMNESEPEDMASTDREDLPKTATES